MVAISLLLFGLEGLTEDYVEDVLFKLGQLSGEVGDQLLDKEERLLGEEHELENRFIEQNKPS
ncbi:MAG: hypothetical protein AAF206_06065 [Bacteroidota bacterium]